MPTNPGAAPSLPVQPGPTPAAPRTSGLSAETSGTLTVWVPFDAKVTINGRETSSTGSRRQYVSHGLKSGLAYKYVVHAQVVRDGQVVEDTRNVVLRAGEITAVAFGFNTTTTAGLALAR
jgi:uncharacterized protein (TIGR03000 family)